MSEAEEIAAEQVYVDRVYACLDVELADVRARLTEALARPVEGPTALIERDGEVQRLARRVNSLRNAETGLCFGRLDRAGGERLYVGRTGISDGERHLVIDWRAPAAEPFYAATAREPLGVVRRRNLTISRRRVVRIDDDVLDPDSAVDDVVGEGALLRVLSASNDGRMRDAVATLQAEQDAIVRAPLAGVMVVQGAPGTGKTVVALHRAAYMLYRSPELLRRGVLVVGPNARFLDYIGDVLPALGETNVVTATIEDLYPGRHNLSDATPEVARLLGDARMAQALTSFIASLQGACDIEGGHVTWDGEDVQIPRAVIERCAAAARKTREPHNVARQTFQAELLDELTMLVSRAEAARLDAIEEGLAEELSLLDSWLECDADSLMPRQPQEELDEQERATRRHLCAELARDATIQHQVDGLWPSLSPEDAVRRVLRDGLTAQHAPHLTDPEVLLLAGTTTEAWTTAHVPLFDEAAEVLGIDDSAERAAADLDRGRELVFARRVLQTDPSLADWMTAETLADRNTIPDHRNLPERDLGDRTWVYGHIIVDEAQELTPMQWRMIGRRCPTKSMTIVGDIAQTTAALNERSWEVRLTELRTRPRVVELTICYRSPRELVEAVEPLLSQLRPDAHPIAAVRATGRRPELIDGDVDDIEQIVQWVRRARDGGQHAIITPDPDRVTRTLENHGITARGDDLRSMFVILPPRAVKGLEFDHVLVHAPNETIAVWGLPTLYVALTRSTATLTVVQRGELAEFFGSRLWKRAE
ncbi:HelD family protein [Microbacterium sp.]|uniref:HelD family protein n=1 Tax=Microbacterium sp. TaxID=51671 RepID=UPI003C724949